MALTFRRLGACEGETKQGSHSSFHRQMADGRILTAVVIDGKRELPSRRHS